jgi:hypothetical protein
MKGIFRYSIFLVRYSAVLRVSAIGANRKNLPQPPFKTIEYRTAEQETEES